MRANPVKLALRAGKMQLGAAVQVFHSQEIPRLLAAAGYQWAFIDAEHGSFDFETLNDVCRVANLAGICPVLRVADFQYGLVARALDCGAGGIILPRVEDVRQLETAIGWTFYPPLGVRGFGMAQHYFNYEPLGLGEVTAHYNDNLLRVIQIETAPAVEKIGEILSVRGVDAVLIGPADLSISLGVPGDIKHPLMVEAIERIRDACIGYGVIPGLHTFNVEMARFWKERGILLLSCASDFVMLFDKASENAKGILEN